MTETSYIAWDDKLYQWPPPDGWYQASDGKWWPEGYGPPAETGTSGAVDGAAESGSAQGAAASFGSGDTGATEVGTSEAVGDPGVTGDEISTDLATSATGTAAAGANGAEAAVDRAQQAADAVGETGEGAGEPIVEGVDEAVGAATDEVESAQAGFASSLGDRLEGAAESRDGLAAARERLGRTSDRFGDAGDALGSRADRAAESRHDFRGPGIRRSASTGLPDINDVLPTEELRVGAARAAETVESIDRDDSDVIDAVAEAVAQAAARDTEQPPAAGATETIDIPDDTAERLAAGSTQAMPLDLPAPGTGSTGSPGSSTVSSVADRAAEALSRAAEATAGAVPDGPGPGGGGPTVSGEETSELSSDQLDRLNADLDAAAAGAAGSTSWAGPDLFSGPGDGPPAAAESATGTLPPPPGFDAPGSDLGSLPPPPGSSDAALPPPPDAGTLPPPGFEARPPAGPPAADAPPPGGPPATDALSSPPALDAPPLAGFDAPPADEASPPPAGPAGAPAAGAEAPPGAPPSNETLVPGGSDHTAPMPAPFDPTAADAGHDSPLDGAAPSPAPGGIGGFGGPPPSLQEDPAGPGNFGRPTDVPPGMMPPSATRLDQQAVLRAAPRSGLSRVLLMVALGVVALVVVGAALYFLLGGDDGGGENAVAQTGPGSAAQPHARTTGVEVFYPDGDVDQRWVIEVLEPVRDATAESPDIPEQGDVFAATRIRVRNDSGVEGASLGDLKFNAVTATGELVERQANACSIPGDDLDFGAGLGLGTQTEGAVCWEIPAAALNGLLLGIESDKVAGRVHISLQ